MRKRRVALVTAVLAAVVGGALGTTATAATLHAAPSSRRVTLPCDPDTPCQIVFAMSQAVAGDDVALAGGSYYATPNLLTRIPFTALPDVTTGVTLHAEPGARRPVLHGRQNAIAPFVRILPGATVSDVEIDATLIPANTRLAYGVSILPGGLLERAVVRTTAPADTFMDACSTSGGVVRDSVCIGDGPGDATGLSGLSGNPVNYTVRNVTAISTAAAGFGLRVGVSSRVSSMTAVNVIARGTSADVAATAGLATGTSTLVLSNSNWGTQALTGAGTPQIISVAANQTGPTAAAPLFLDAPGGDYRPVAGSPTIDAGATDAANGPLALGGQARTLGAGTDMGAFEFDPTPPAAPAAPGPAPAAPPPPAATPTSSASPGVIITRDTTAPALSSLSIGRRWRTGSRLVPRSAKHPAVGTPIRFTLSEQAQVTLAFSRQLPGRRVGRTCRPASAATRTRPRCTISSIRGRRVVAGRAGVNTVTFLGRVSPSVPLGSGAHLLTATAVDAAGNQSVARTARFTILK